MNNKAKIFADIERVATILPTPLFWMDRNNVGLGCNDLVLQSIGAATSKELLGKTPSDYLPQDIVNTVIKNINKVIQEKKAITFEESIKDRKTEEMKYLLMARAPLFDDNGIDVVGTVVSAIDITDRKENERLRIEAELQKVKIQEQARFKKIVDQAAHDTQSPLALLLILAQQCIGLTKEKIFDHLKALSDFIPLIIYWVDTSTAIIGANRHFLTAVGGRSIDDFIGRGPYDFYHFEMADNIARNSKEVMQTGKVLSQEEVI